MTRIRRTIGSEPITAVEEVVIPESSLVVVGYDLQVSIDGSDVQIVDLSILNTLTGLVTLNAIIAALTEQPKNVHGLVTSLIARVPK